MSWLSPGAGQSIVAPATHIWYMQFNEPLVQSMGQHLLAILVPEVLHFFPLFNLLG